MTLADHLTRAKVRHLAGLVRAGKASGRKGRRDDTSGAGLSYPVSAARPTASDRAEALVFFESVLAVLDAAGVDEMGLSAIIRALGGEMRKRLPTAITRHLDAARISPVMIMADTRNCDLRDGLTREQVERAIGRLRPAQPGARAGR